MHFQGNIQKVINAKAIERHFECQETQLRKEFVKSFYCQLTDS